MYRTNGCFADFEKSLLAKSYLFQQMVGPMTNNLADLYGDYQTTIDPRYGKTPLQGLSRLAEEVGYGPGCMDTRCTNYTRSNVTKALSGAQLIIVSLGTGRYTLGWHQFFVFLVILTSCLTNFFFQILK